MNSEAIAQIAHETTPVNARRVSMSSSPVSLHAHSSTSDQASPHQSTSLPLSSTLLLCACVAQRLPPCDQHRPPRRSLPPRTRRTRGQVLHSGRVEGCPATSIGI